MNYVISLKFLNCSLSSLIITPKRSVTIQNKVDLGVEMKLLNDKKQFTKALELFDKHKHNNIQTFSSLTITQTLKACAHVQDVQRGSTIHRLILSRVNNDFYILVSLIHLYMQCGDVARAQSLFDNSTKKTLEIYGAMMKGFITNNMSRKAVDLFSQVEHPNAVIINLLFNACAQLGTKEALELAKQVSLEMPKSFYSNPYIPSSLLDALMKCGDVVHAQSVFDASTKKVLSMYGAMMKGYMKNKMTNKAIDLFYQVQNPDEILINLLFNACAALGTKEALALTKKVAEEMPKSFYLNSFILSSLLDASMKCGDVAHAQSLFDASTTKVLSMYGAMMKGYVINNMANKAIDLFNRVKNPNEILINLFFNACAALGTKQALTMTKRVSKQMPQSFYFNPYTLSSLLDALMKCGDVAHARSLFDASTNKITSLYGTMMKGYTKNNMANKAIDLFNQVEIPDEIVTNLLFNSCAQLGTKEALELVKQVSQEMPKSFYSNHYILSSLLDALMKCGDVTHAQSVFDASTKKVLSMYGAMMKGYMKNKMANKAIDLFYQVQNPDEILINLLFNACAALGTKEALALTKKVAEEMPKSFYSNSLILSSLLDASMKCGDVAHAQSLFDTFTNKTQEMYGAMMKGYIHNGLPNKAIDLFHEINNPDEVNLILLFNACAHLKTKEVLDLAKQVSQQMLRSSHLNPCVSTSLLDALIKCGDISSAESLFSKITRSSVNYGILMSGFNEEINFNKTLSLFHQMKTDGVEPDSLNYLHVIKASSRIGDFSLSQSIVKQIPPSLLLDSHIQAALVDMWGRVGYIDQAKEMFDQIHQPDRVGYTSMINSYGLNGMGSEALELYRQMPQDLIDEVTNVCVLNACSHAGLVDEARLIFQKIQNKTQSIFGAMIDCLSRASFFDEAQTLIDEYERCHLPVVSMYMALLSGARNEKNIHVSQSIYNRMKKLFPNEKDPMISAAVLLANVYGSSGELDQASDIRIQMHKSGAKKKVGLSWTTVNGEPFKFRAHDQSHTQMVEINAENERISQQLLQHGHRYDASWITRPLGQHETVASVLCGHSERLAIAWNFVANPNTKLIQVTKNLRMCGDCHRSTKLIAAIRQCEIIVRDANRIHHFYPNGQCSCNDYF